MSNSRPQPLAGVRVIESSMLGAVGITTHLADLGADVIKVEPPAGDYIRQMTWPIVEGVPLMHPPLFPHAEYGADMLPFSIRFRDEALVPPTKAPEVGEQSAQVLREVLAYDEAQIKRLKEQGAFG